MEVCHLEKGGTNIGTKTCQRPKFSSLGLQISGSIPAFLNVWPPHEEAILLPSRLDFIVSLHRSRIFACRLPTNGTEAT